MTTSNIADSCSQSLASFQFCQPVVYTDLVMEVAPQPKIHNMLLIHHVLLFLFLSTILFPHCVVEYIIEDFMISPNQL